MISLYSNNDIPEFYRNSSLHIALEKADTRKDWKTFKILYQLDPEFLKNHLYMTSIFDYNYTKLTLEEQNNLMTP